MTLVEIKSKDQLNKFVSAQKYSQFLQSWEWGEFQKKFGYKVFRIGVEDDGNLLGVATLIKKNIGLGKSYFYCPRGPVFDEIRISKFKFRIEDVEELLFEEIKKIAKREKVIFLRYEPLDSNRKSKIENRKSIDLQPAKTLMLDLRKNEEELLADMHQKTRYNIRLAEKKGVLIIEGGLGDFDDFWELMNATSNRDGFKIHPKEHYKKLIETEFLKLYFAKYESKMICTGIFSFFGNTATYLHGASSNEHRNMMAPFLLQWELVRMAKRENKEYYDFYGIDDEKWPGVSRFKKGFGGFEMSYPGTYDIVFNGVCYNGYKALRKIRRAF